MKLDRGRCLQVVRDLRWQIQSNRFDQTAYHMAGEIEAGIESERRLELIDALKHCERLLDNRDPAHGARASQ